MKRPTRTTAVGLAAALGLTMAVIPGVVSAEEDVPPPVPEFVSTLTLDTKSTPQLTLEGTTLAQTLTANPSSRNACSLDKANAQSLLSFVGYLGSTPNIDVGFRTQSLGVNERISSVCNRVDALSSTNQVETLEITLAPSLEVVNDVPVLGAKSASLDIEVISIQKFLSKPQKAVVEAKAYDANNKLLKTTSITQGIGDCAATESSNCRLDITMDDPDTYFTKLTLTAKAGGFSLEGGSDQVPNSNPVTTYAPSTFELVTLVDDTFTCEADQDFTDENATVVYIGTAGDPDACEAFGITLDATAEEVVFLKPLAVDPGAQFIFDVTWTKPNEGGSPALSIPTAEIDFEFPGGVGFTPMGFCPPSVYDETTGKLVGLPSGLIDDAAILAKLELTEDFEPSFPGVQFACLDRQRGLNYVTKTEDGQVKDSLEIQDKIYLIGDARMRL